MKKKFLGLLMSKTEKALLFINGQEPKNIPDVSSYSIVTCTDGAYSSYVKNLNLKVNYISGDMDSIDINTVPSGLDVIYTPDPNKTDFDKALEILIEKGIKEIDVYGASGKESDHFIGNISTALLFKNRLKLTFFDDFSTFFFSDKQTVLSGVKGKIISLIPFFKAYNIVTLGLLYPLKNETLSFPERIGTRNTAIEDIVEITYSEGELLIYIGK